MIRFVHDVAAWDGALPGALVTPIPSGGHRRELLQRMVAKAFDRTLDEVVIEHREGRRPTLSVPTAAGLFLSCASRAGVAALAVAWSPIGVDVEIVDPLGTIPWNVLHPAEGAVLRALASDSRDRAFARLWSLKEAYLKAQGLGLRREPSSFEIRVLDGQCAAVNDPDTGDGVAVASTVWLDTPHGRAAASVVILNSQRSGTPRSSRDRSFQGRRRE